MKVLFIISSSDTAFWLSEVTHPYWHLTERGVEVDFASPNGGKVVFDPYSDPYFEKTTEPDDLVSKGFLADKKLAKKLETTLTLKDVDLSAYDAIHVAGGRGATFDLYPNADVAKALEYFWARDKVVGAICHWAIFPSGSAAAASPDSRSKETSSCRLSSEPASSYLTIRRRSWKRLALFTPAPNPMPQKSLSTESWSPARISNPLQSTRSRCCIR
jgi:hypothetical protein